MGKKIRVWDGSAWQDVSVALPYNAVHSAQASMPSTAVDGQIWLDTDGTLSDTQYIPKTLTSTTGDIIYASSANTPARLGIGTSGQVLGISGGVPSWTTLSASIPANAVSYVNANESTTSTSFTDLTTAGPTVTLTTGTKALVIVGCRMEGISTTTRGYMGFTVSGASTVAANEGRAQELKVTADQFIDQKSFAYIITGLTAGSNTFTAKYKSQTGSIVYYTERRISVIDMGS